MFKRVSIAAACLTAAAALAGAAEAGQTGALSCQMTKQRDIDNGRLISQLDVVNTSGRVIPASATYEVSFYNWSLVRPGSASIKARTAVLPGSDAYLSDPFTSQVQQVGQTVPCRAYAHWIDFRPGVNVLVRP